MLTTTDLNKSVSVTREELILLLNFSGSKDLPGFGKPEKYSVDQRNPQYEYAFRSLLARGFAHIENDQLIINDEIIKLLKVCVNPKKSLYIYHIQPNKLTKEFFIHYSGKNYVLFSTPMSGLYSFQEVLPQDVVGTSMRIGECQDLPFSSFEPFEISKTKLLSIRERTETDKVGEAYKFLIQGGANRDSARQFIHTLARPKGVTVYIFLSPIDEQELRRTEFTVFWDEKVTWIMDTKLGSLLEETYCLSSKSAEDIRKFIVEKFLA